MNDRSRALLDCLTLGELQLLSAIYHHLSRLETKRRSPKGKKIPVKWFWSLGVPQSSPTFVGKERVTKLEGRLHRRLCLRRLNFKTHFLRVRRAKHWANESGYSVCKKKISNLRQSGIKPYPFQTQTYGSSLFPISGHKTQTDKWSKTTPFGPENPPSRDFYVCAKALSNDF